VCTSCGQRKPCDRHHPAREVVAPEITVPECPADHRVLDRLQEQAGIYRVKAPRSEIERVRWIFGGVFQTLMRVRSRDDETDRRLGRMGELMAGFADMLLGLLDVGDQPLEAFGPDPILRTLRTFRGSRPVRRPGWRASKEPPEATDAARSRALFEMVEEAMRATAGDCIDVLAGMNVESLLSRLAELERDCSLDPLAVVVEDLTRVFESAVRARSPEDVIGLAEAFHRILRLGDRLSALFGRLGAVMDTAEARRDVEAFFTWYENEGRLMGETAHRGTEPAPGGGPSLHDEEAH
jgi:hypothetical protein